MIKIIEQLTLQPDIHAGLGFSEDEDEEEDEIQNQPSTGNSQSGATQQTRSTQKKKPTNDTPVLDNFGTDMTRAAEEGKLDPCSGAN